MILPIILRRRPNLSDFLLLFFLICPAVVWADPSDSMIEKIQEAEKSVVHIQAAGGSILKSPQARAAINPHTGQIIVARGIKTAEIKRSGTGVIINAEGMIVTNFHTIQYAQTILVTFFSGESIPAKIVHMIPQSDLALLKVDPPFPLRPIILADSNKVELGDDVVDIGGSRVLYHVLSGGRIIGLAKNNLTQAVEFIKVNIDLYKGDSGGPLLNRQGELVGMIMAEIKNKDKSTLAIPSNKIKILYLDFIN